MARSVFRLPDIGEGIAEAEIVGWHVQPGDRVREGDPLADVMTDKATIALEAPFDGTVVALAGAMGDRIAIGSALVTFETEEGGETEGEVGEALADAPPVKAKAVPAHPPATPERAAPAAAAPRMLASPAVRARARDLGIDLADVKTRDGHVRHADLDAFLLYGAQKGYRPPHDHREWADRTEPLVGLRRRIAENMAAAKSHIPHFTYVEEIDVTALEATRAQLNAGRGERAELTVLPLLILAICKALPDYPMLNARFDDAAGKVTYHGHVHLGLATHTDAGLMVPVIRDAQDRNVWQLAAEIARLAAAVRGGTAKAEELSGSTITVSSLGRRGGIAATPIVNWPEVAVIAPNRMIERPVFAGDKVVAAKLMNLSISCDHRIVDGWHAAGFVQALKHLIETPVLLFQE